MRFSRRPSRYNCARSARAGGPTTASDNEIPASRLTYERLGEERDRIREARAFFARQLGPLPAFAGISVAAVGAFSEQIRDETWLWLAFGAVAAMVLTSVLYSRMPSYRELRAERVKEGLTQGDESMGPAAWYQAELKLERRLYRASATRGKLWRLPRRNLQGDLQEQLDKERVGLFLVQFWLLLVVGFLVLARFD